MGGPALAEVAAAVRRGCADLPVGALVLVACSGGPDSLALAAAAAAVAPRAGWRAGAVVVDHGLQPGSAAVADTAAGACAALGLSPVEVVPVAVGRAGGPEAAARTARHGVLEAAAARLGAAAVLLGHTLDDQAEQVLLGLVRGSGARSLAGMPARRGLLRRPLLGVPRATTAAACEEQGLQPWHDPANSDPASTRARVRSRVLPVVEEQLGPGMAAALARTAEQLREDAEVLEALAAGLLTAASRAAGGAAGGAAGLELDAAVMAAAPTAVRRRALRAALVAAGAGAGEVHRRHVLAVDALLTTWHGQGPLALPGRLGVRRSCGRLVIARAVD